MALSQLHVTPATPMGANLVADGATFRCWAPAAQAVHLVGRFGGVLDWSPNDQNQMVRDGDGYWSGFVPGVVDGDEYKFYVFGEGSKGHKRDPYARELTDDPPYPFANCVVRDPSSYPWHDDAYRPPAVNDLIIYQFHVGTFYGPNRERRVARFLDVLDRLDYLVALGVNAIEPLPVVEFASPRSLGYDGSDLFSPENDFQVEPQDIDPYLGRVNGLLARQGLGGLTREQLAVPINQLKALIDLCHLNGLAVIFDVVYNHAGFQVEGQDESLYFFDRAADRDDPNQSQYFTDRTHTGPVFAIWKKEVRQFLVSNARFFADEYHVDGFRYDQVSVIVQENIKDGWGFCQELTSAVRQQDSSTLQVAEYWPVDPWVARSSGEGGAGFDAAWHDGLRTTIRNAVGQAAGGRDAWVQLGPVASSLVPAGFEDAWRAVQCVESHDEVYRGRAPRIASLSGGGEARSWYARSRSRVASGLVLTAPGTPMLFMGQEILEDKQWSDNPEFDPGTLIWWEGLERGDKSMVNHLRFTSELIALRRRHPALRSERINVFHVNDGARVIAFHRWLDGRGRDIVVVATLSEDTHWEYELGMPRKGRWLEVFNSDVYDYWFNPWVAGNRGSIHASGPAMHGLAASARMVIPANSLLVFALDEGDWNLRRKAKR